jgi:hypothetical protein
VVQDAYIHGFALRQTDMSTLVEVVGGYVAKVRYDDHREFLFGIE